MAVRPARPQIRLAELVAALSLATDLGMGQPLEQSLCSCVLAIRLGEALGMDEGALRDVYYQALLRYIGCNAETYTLAAIWGKEGPLSEREWERVRLHPYYTERVLARPDALAQLSALASSHHERLDGSGYHRRAVASSLSPMARILAAADVYHAMTELRPHRPAHAPVAAADELRRAARAGLLDGEAVSGVLAEAGHLKRMPRQEMVAGLSEREMEVLRLLARGNTLKQMAAQLTLSSKTMDNHIQHIYNKLGVSTRAGATLFAMEQHLLSDVD